MARIRAGKCGMAAFPASACRPTAMHAVLRHDQVLLSVIQETTP